MVDGAPKLAVEANSWPFMIDSSVGCRKSLTLETSTGTPDVRQFDSISLCRGVRRDALGADKKIITDAAVLGRLSFCRRQM